MITDRLKIYREREPVHWHKPSGAWLVTRFDDVARLLADRRLTSRTLQAHVENFPGLDQRERTDLANFFGNWLSLTDGARHSDLRGFVAPILAPSRIAPWAAHFEEMANEQASRADLGRVELSFARPYAAAVIGAVLGLTADETARALTATAKLVGVLGPGDVDEHRAHAARKALDDVSELVARAIGGPARTVGPDSLLRGTDLPDELQVALFVQFVGGGYDPLARCITAYALSEQSAQQRRFSDDLVDEVIRLYGPFELLPRIALQPIEIGSHRLQEGSRVLLAIGSANRDESQFPDSSMMRPSRPVRHLAFGGGPHRCPATSLARPAVRAAVRALMPSL